MQHASNTNMPIHYAPSTIGGAEPGIDTGGASIRHHTNNGDEEFRPNMINRAVTGLEPNPIIQKFLRDEFHPEHWDACASRAEKLIEKRLRGLRDANNEEIQYMVTCRAKKPKSLEEKLKMRNLERSVKGEEEYGSGQDILQDIKDLAGVRVVLYTPNKAQRDTVKRVIHEIWEVVEGKAHGDRLSNAAAEANEKKGSYVRRHLGYQAEHYRAQMQKKHSKDPYNWKEDDMVEIQVVSALGHAWAEAGHDVLYKTHAYGRPPNEEHRILDALNGLIISGDLLLEQFRESVTRRTVARWEQFEPFVMFLRDSDILEKTSEPEGVKVQEGYLDHFNKQGKDILYRFLVRIGDNFPLAVRNALRDFGYPEDPLPGLEEELNRYQPHLRPPVGLLTPFCVISKMMCDKEPIAKWLHPQYTITEKCTIMMDALICLQTFAGSCNTARSFLLQLDLTVGDYGESESLDFVLSSPHRRNCFGGPGAEPPKHWIGRTLDPGWDWFCRQAQSPQSLCGLFFRLAIMNVPAQVVDAHERLKILKILALSRSSTMEDPQILSDSEREDQNGVDVSLRGHAR